MDGAITKYAGNGLLQNLTCLVVKLYNKTNPSKIINKYLYAQMFMHQNLLSTFNLCIHKQKYHVLQLVLFPNVFNLLQKLQQNSVFALNGQRKLIILC